MAPRRNSGRCGTRPTRTAQPPKPPKLPKTAHRVHDAVDLASGRIETTSTARAPGVATRLRRLTRFGFLIDLTLFGPSYHLTAQTPYQATPEAWLDAFAGGSPVSASASDGVYSADPLVNRIWWRLPATFETVFMPTVNFNFRGLGTGPAVLSLKFEAFPQPGRTGTVLIRIGFQDTEIPISEPVEHTIDVALVLDGGKLPVVQVLMREGVRDFVFREVSVASGPFIVLDPNLVVLPTG